MIAMKEIIRILTQCINKPKLCNDGTFSAKSNITSDLGDIRRQQQQLQNFKKKVYRNAVNATQFKNTTIFAQQGELDLTIVK